jgi:hypothetical protein
VKPTPEDTNAGTIWTVHHFLFDLDGGYFTTASPLPQFNTELWNGIPIMIILEKICFMHVHYYTSILKYFLPT